MTNQQGVPEALRLADALECRTTSWPDKVFAAAELRRLHAENVRLAALVEAQQPATHVQNPAEIEHVANDVSKNGAESNMAQQPAPSAAAAGNFYPHAELRKTWQPGQRWQARSFRNGRWGPWTDAVASEPFWFPHQEYRRHPDDLAPQPSPTPQADSAPASVAGPMQFGGCPECGSRSCVARECSRTVSHAAQAIPCVQWQCGQQASGFTAPQADSQPSLTDWYEGITEKHFDLAVHKAVQRDRAARAPADSVTAPATDSYVQPVPDKCDRIVWRGHYYHLPPTTPAQAADSVTAPAGGAVMEPTPVTDADVRDMSARVISGQAEEDELVAFFERLVPPRPVRITHEADSVLEDAGGANWQDISTAPKDGTRFVAVGQNYGLDSEAQHTCMAQWFRGCWIEVSEWNEISELKYLTHWMSLPPLPGSAARAPADSLTAPARPSKPLPYEPTSAMLIAAREQDPALPIEMVRAIYWAMWRKAPTPPTQAADSVLEDAARYEYLRDCTMGERSRLEHYSGPALDVVIDAARKQGANHDNA